MGARPLSKMSGSAPGKKERSSQAGRERGRAGRERGRAGRERGRAGRQEGVREGRQAGRERGRVGRERVRAGRQAGGDGGHADPVLLPSSFNLLHQGMGYNVALAT